MSPFITCTGIDERTDLDDVRVLATPGVEFGILLSANPEGRPRYPGISFLLDAVNLLRRRAAVHICGTLARERLMEGVYDTVLREVGRIQVNGKVSVDEVATLTKRFSRQRIVTQHNEHNDALARVSAARHDLLVDASGGRGVRPDDWVHPMTDKRVGFAGGITPDTIAADLREILRVARIGWWIDMESGLRTNDWFDVAKAERCIEIATAFCEGRAA